MSDGLVFNPDVHALYTINNNGEAERINDHVSELKGVAFFGESSCLGKFNNKVAKAVLFVTPHDFLAVINKALLADFEKLVDKKECVVIAFRNH